MEVDLFPQGVPDALRRLPLLLKVVPDAATKKALKLSVDLLTVPPAESRLELCRQANEDILAKYPSVRESSEQPFEELVTAGFLILERLSSCPTSEVAAAVASLKPLFGAPDSFVSLLQSVVDARLADIRSRLEEDRRLVGPLPTFQGVRWRVDVCISHSLMQKVLRPSILMQITAGRHPPGQDVAASTVQLELSVEELSKLRLAVASALKALNAMESNPLLHIEKK